MNLATFKFQLAQVSTGEFCCFDLDKSMAISGNCEEVFGMNDVHKSRVLWENFELGEKGDLIGHSDIITALRYATKTRQLYTAGKDCSIIQWDFPTKKKKREFKGLHQSDIFTMQILLDERFVATGSKDKTVKLLNLETFQVEEILNMKNCVYGLTDFKEKLYCYGKNSIQLVIWDLEKYQCDGPKTFPMKSKKRESKGMPNVVFSCAIDKMDNRKIDHFFSKSKSIDTNRSMSTYNFI